MGSCVKSRRPVALRHRPEEGEEVTFWTAAPALTSLAFDPMALPGGYARKSQPTLSTDLRQRLAQKAGFEQAQAAFKCLETACNLRKGLQLLAEMPP